MRAGSLGRPSPRERVIDTMEKPVRLRLSRAAGFDLQAHSLSINGLPVVNVARPTPWGNPFEVGVHGTREECVHLYVALVHGLLAISAGKSSVDAQKNAHQHIVAHRNDIAGKNLACWCPLPKAGERDMCHAAVLLEIVNDWPVDRRGV